VERFWDGIRRGVAVIEIVNAAVLEIGWVIGRDFPDQDFSIVDRTSVAVMQRLGLRQVPSFDDDFAMVRACGRVLSSFANPRFLKSKVWAITARPYSFVADSFAAAEAQPADVQQ
jgi:hypothetical protein